LPCTTCGGLGLVGNDVFLAQVFTQGTSGYLTRHRLRIANSNSYVTNIHVSTYSTLGSGEPNIMIGSEVSVSGTSVGGTAEWVNFTFATPVLLTAGTEYAIVMRADQFDWDWQRHSNGVYPGGEAWSSLDSGGTWASMPAADFVFETYVGTNAPPTARDDNVTTDEDTVLYGNVTVDNGGGPDNDTDGDPLSVVEVNGNPANVGVQFALPSGALLTQQANGTFEYDPNGQFDYLAAGDFFVENYTYMITDGNGSFDNATVFVNVTGMNDAPVITGAGGTVNFVEDSPPIVIDPSLTVTDVDDLNLVEAWINITANHTTGQDTLAFTNTASITGTWSNGQGTMHLVGTDNVANYELALESITYENTAPNPDINPRTITWWVTDGDSFSVGVNSTITISPQNDAPTAVDDSGAGYTTDEETAFDTANVTFNDTDPEGDPLSVSGLDTAMTIGTVTDNGNNTFHYDPNGQFEYLAVTESAIDSFNYTVTDGNGGFDNATVNITVNGVNDAPTAVDDGGPGFITDEDTPFTTANVLTNDTDPDLSDVLSLSGYSDLTIAGSLTSNGDGTFNYDSITLWNYLAVGENHTEFFVYTVTDGNGGFDNATVNITITGVNDIPTPFNDSGPGFVTGENTPFTTASVLTNDTDPDFSDVLSVFGSDTTGTVGFVINNGDGTFDYDPNGMFGQLAAGETALDFFNYTVTDGNGGFATAMVTIILTGVNQAPTAVDDAPAAFAEDSGPNAIDVLANDIDPDTNDVLLIIGVTQGGNGTVVITGGGTGLTYEPDADYFGPDTFTYTISDGNGGTDTATVTVTVTNDNADAPEAVNDAVTINEDSGANTIDVLLNDDDVDGHTLTIIAVTSGAHGTVNITNGGTDLTYTPDPDFHGTDTFTYTVDDGTGLNDTATVTVTVTNINDDPTANDDSIVVDEDSGATQIAVLANDGFAPDPAETLKVTAITQGAHGTVAILSSGAAVTYAPDADFNGFDSFTYTISDGNGGTSTATVSVTVNNVNDPPTISGTHQTSAEEGDAYSVTYTATDIDAGDTLTWSVVTGATWLLMGTSNGTLYGQAAPGSFSVRVRVSDGHGGTDFQEFNLLVTRMDSDDDGVPDDDDEFPHDANETVDSDGDGTGDNADTDDDNDGTPDGEDAFPTDASETVDTDGDGIGNNADTDDDGDGVADALDPAPLDPTIRADYDQPWPYMWLVYLMLIIVVLGAGCLLVIRWWLRR